VRVKFELHGTAAPFFQQEKSVETTVFVIVSFVFGYAAAVNSWPLIKTWVNGVEVEAATLRAQADALLAKSKLAGGK
jgi:hypothetical protein